MKIKCIIVDDERLARKLVHEYILKIPFLEEVGEFQNGTEALAFLKDNHVDVVFLDIQMPDLTGLEVIKSLKVKPHFILTTAYDQYALDGYELNVLDYLVKPFSFERFAQAVEKAKHLLEMENNVAAQIRAGEDDHFFVKSDYKHIKVKYADILYIEGMKEYVALRLKDNSRVVYLATMKVLEEEFRSKGFIRVHKSYIVSSRHIAAFSGHNIEIGESKIPIGKNYRSLVEELIKK